MLGMNPIDGPHTLSEDFKVNSIWRTIQGEGPWSGLPAIFVRFSGCCLRCTWCDTSFETGTWRNLPMLADEIHSLVRSTGHRRVVFTGGEPMLWPLGELITMLHDSVEAQIETAGTVWPEGLDRVFERANVSIVCSPKTPKVHPKIIHYADAWKYIIRVGCVDPQDGLPIGSTQRGIDNPTQKLYRADTSPNKIFVQPCDEDDPRKNAANLQEAVLSSLRFGYRLSLQIHKIAGVP